MDRPRYTRQWFFFLLAVLVPSTALLVVGVGFLVQERELAASRAVDARVSYVRDVGRLLEDRLSQNAGDASARRLIGVDSLRMPANSGVLWVGTWVGGQFRPAWSYLRSSQPVTWGEKTAAMKNAERLEFRSGKPGAAADEYAHLARHASDTRRASQARLRAARALTTAGIRGRAAIYARQVLETNSSVQDEFGVPFAYYAADMLLLAEADSIRSLVADRLAADALDPKWFVPERTYMLRDLLVSAGAVEEAIDAANRRADETRLAAGLQDDLGGLVRSGAAERWVRYGDRLLGAGPTVSDVGRDYFAITPEALTGLADQTGVVVSIQLEGDQSEGALSLRPYFREAYLTLSPTEITTDSIPRGFLVLLLATLVGLTLFGGYLLWRDVQRENRLGQLRAQFVSSVSHEFRTPLTSIRMFAEVMMTGTDTPAEHQRYLGVISNESDRLTRMLNNVLSASRIEQGTISYHAETGDVRLPVRAAVETMRYTFDQQGVSLAVIIPESPTIAYIDPDAIEQGVLNLLSNALKYGDGSPVSVRVQSGEHDEIDILVSDGGPGVDASEQALIFERFYRTSSAQNGRNTGVGLGLPLVKHIAEGHGGRVSIKSELGKGTTFGIHIPETP